MGPWVILASSLSCNFFLCFKKKKSREPSWVNSKVPSSSKFICLSNSLIFAKALAKATAWRQSLQTLLSDSRLWGYAKGTKYPCHQDKSLSPWRFTCTSAGSILVWFNPYLAATLVGGTQRQLDAVSHPADFLRQDSAWAFGDGRKWIGPCALWWEAWWFCGVKAKKWSAVDSG